MSHLKEASFHDGGAINKKMSFFKKAHLCTSLAKKGRPALENWNLPASWWNGDDRIEPRAAARELIEAVIH